VSARGTWALAGLAVSLLLLVVGLVPFLEGPRPMDEHRELDRDTTAAKPATTVVEGQDASRGSREEVVLVFRGRVVEPDGAALEGALIELGDATASTGPDGRFRCDLPSAIQAGRVSKRGYETLVVAVPPVGAGPGSAIDLGTLTLIPRGSVGARLAGRVIDADRKPLADVDVRFGQRVGAGDAALESCLQRVFLGADSNEHEDGSVRSQADGSFSIPLDDLRDGVTVWAATPDRSQAGELTLAQPSPDAYLLLRLEPVRTLAGHVVDVAGRGVADAPICAAPFGQDLTRAPSFSSRWVRTTTADDGAFELSGVPHGPLSIGVGAEALEVFRVTALTDEDLLLTLGDSRTVDGRLIDAATDEPIAGGRVHSIVTALAGDQVASSEAVSDETGRFRLSGVPREGVLNLIVRHADYAVAGTRLPGSSLWTGGEVSAHLFDEPIDIQLERGARLTLDLSDRDGVPVRGAAIELSGHGGLVRSNAVTDAEGRAEFEHLTPGTYVADVATEAGHASLDPAGSWIELGEGVERHSLRLVSAVRVRGRLVDVTGEPLAGGAVTVRTQPRGAAFFTSEIEAHADGEGRFDVAGLPAGAAFALDLQHPDELRARLDGELHPGETELDLGDVVLTGMATIEGLVLKSDRTPIDGAELYVVSSSGGGAPIAEALSGADGRFRITGVEARPSVVIARKDGYYATRIKRLDPSPGTTTSGVLLVLAEGQTHAGHVTNRRNAAFPGATVTAHWAPTYEGEEGEGIGATALRKLLAFNRASAISREDGTFELKGVPPDQPIEFTAFAEGFQAEPVSFSPFFVDVDPDVHIVLGKLAR